MISAMAIIKKEVPNCRLIIIGDGSSRTDLENLVVEKNLEKNVKFLGFRRDIPGLLMEMNVFVLPSLWEGLGNVILEAMAAQRPVVATKVGGIPEMVNHNETGFLVPPGDSKMLAAEILKLLKDSQMRINMGKAGRERVEEKFSIDNTVNGLEAVYDELIKRKIK